MNMRIPCLALCLTAALAIDAAAAQPFATPHPMPYRILWTWDSWLCDPFNADSYVNEYRKLIDFMAENDYNGLIIWGFLDDRHGGEAAAKQIASYGRSRGVRILPGIGAGGYHGFSISEGTELNLVTFLRNRPDLRAIPRRATQPSGEFICLYQPGAIEWLRAGSRYLAENFEIGGVNIETNEADGIDNCEHAAAATKQEPNRLRHACSFSDMVQAVPPIFEEIRRRHPDAWITYATYQPPWWQRREDDWLLKKLPEEAIAQWNMELNVADNQPSPVKNNISLIHSGGWSYHLAPWPPTWAFTQYRCFYPNLQEAQRFAANQVRLKTNGFVVGNVGSADMPDNEIAYIAMVEFTRDPAMTIEQFSARFIARLYGERAEPLVLELMLKQPAVHQRVQQVWRNWTRAIYGRDRGVPLSAARAEDIAALKAQVALAQRALDVASEGGRRRLNTIIGVLEEYRIIAEMSASPELAAMREDRQQLSAEALREVHGRLVEMARREGLPDEIYRYSRLAR